MRRLGAPLFLVLLFLALWIACSIQLSSIAAAATATPASAASAKPTAAAKRYICPPCGAPCDTLSFDKPGVCPQCGMTLVDAEAVAAEAAALPPPKKVAIVIFNGAEILDFTGPWEMFGAAGCDVYAVAATKDPITTSMGMTVVPKYTFADAPQPDVLVIPGGGVKAATESQPTLDYIRSATAHTQTTMSVCNGAFILANTGLLDGLKATTTYHNIPVMAQRWPKVTVVRDQRYVDNGKLVTTAGLSAGIDGALHVISELFGPGYAQNVALGEEYAWDPNGGFVRGMMADHEIPDITIDQVGLWKVTRTEGNRDHWDIGVAGTSKLAPDAFMGYVESDLAKGKWTKVGATHTSGATRSSEWRFTGSDGKAWKGTLEVAAPAGADQQLTASISVARAG